MSQKQFKPGLIGKKIGMTQVFTDAGECIGVTVIQVGPCVITQVKTAETDGYHAIQLGFEETKLRKLTKPQQGHFQKKSIKPFRILKEVRVKDASIFKVGQTLSVEVFKENEEVQVSGISKGKGFQGVIKRHHKGGGPASHGSQFHRSTGSIGQRTWPGRVFKLMKLPGHMGSEKVSVDGLKIIKIDVANHWLLVQGAVPGGKKAIVMVRTQDFANFEKVATAGDGKEAPKEGESKVDQKDTDKEAAEAAA